MRKVRAAFLLSLLLCVCAILSSCQAATNVAHDKSGLTLTLYSVGKADAILIETPDGALMIDTGTDNWGIPLALNLSEKGIDKLDALIITHFDKDHVGGADAILNNIAVGQVVEPDYAKDSKQHEQYLDAMARVNLTPLTLRESTELAIAGLTLRVLAAKENYEDENDHSLVVSIQYGDVRFLFTGDIENPRLRELLDSGEKLEHDFLKVPHHGRSEKLSGAFFQAINPKLAVITSSEDEPEDKSIVDSLRATGAEVYLTRAGEVTITCDGKSLTVTQN